MAARLQVGVDIGGTTLVAVAVAVAESGIVARAGAATPAQGGPDAVLDAVATLVTTVDPDSRRDLVAVGTAGLVDPLTGRVVAATAALRDWAGTDIAAGLADRLRFPSIRVLNDAHAFAVAEWAVGAAQGARSVVAVTVGTGIGGALLFDGRLVLGRRAGAGNVGHIPSPAATGIPCPCGRHGHVEAVASAVGMLAAYRRSGGRRADLHDVANDASAGDELAQAALAAGAAALGTVLGGLVNTFDPDVIVIGGGAAGAGHYYFDPLNDALRTTSLPFLADIAAVPASLGADAVALGAILAATRGVVAGWSR